MSSCAADIKRVTTVLGTVVTTQYLDLRQNPPVLIDQAAYDALTKVRCPETSVDWEKVCLQPIGNTDAANIVPGMENVVKYVTFSDEMGTVATVAVQAVNLFLNDGTDVTATHEVVACPSPVVIEADVCVAP